MSMSIYRTQQRSGGQPEMGLGQNRILALPGVPQNIHADGRRRTAPDRRHAGIVSVRIARSVMGAG
jgi:hypothetical protein